MTRLDRELCVTPAVLGLGAFVLALRNGQPVALAVGIKALVAGFVLVPLALRR